MTTDEGLHPELVLGDGPEATFRALPGPPRWAFMKMAVAAKSDDGTEQMAAMYQLALACVVKSERNRMDTYLVENDEAMDRLEPGLETLSNFWAGRPLVRSSLSAEPSPTPAPAPSSPVASSSVDTESGSTSVRVVDFGAAWEADEKRSSTA